MTEHRDNNILLEEETANHDVAKTELDRYRECCRSWETAYNAALANITQLSARVSYLEKMLCAAQIGNQQLTVENGRLNLTIRHLVRQIHSLTTIYTNCL